MGCALIMSVTSCKKTYTCECVTTSTYGSGVAPSINKSTVKEYSAKMSEKQAQAACDHEAETIKSTFDNSFTENGSTSNFANVSTDCELK